MTKYDKQFIQDIMKQLTSTQQYIPPQRLFKRTQKELIVAICKENNIAIEIRYIPNENEWEVKRREL